MDWPSHISPEHWRDVPYNNIASRSTAPEPHPSISQLIDSTALSTTYSSEEPFSQDLFVQPSYDSLGSNPLDVRHAAHFLHSPIDRNEHQHITMRDNLSWSNLMPKRPILPRSTCNGGQQRPTETTSGLPKTHGRPERTKSLICKWENCRKPPFQSKGALMRHIDTQHVAPRSFKCPDQSCDRFFSRKDNMDEHVRRVHWVRESGESL